MSAAVHPRILLTELANVGVVVELGPGGALDYTAQPGCMTERIRQTLRERKADLVAHLSALARRRDFAGWPPDLQAAARTLADRLAADGWDEAAAKKSAVARLAAPAAFLLAVEQGAQLPDSVRKLGDTRKNDGKF